ncbi:hypothetical protein KVR01_013266 [Diaporthe batatas]|uniref:uncharacterized protein n=1 Tax=Diaporthe batatas TaxID=748121 RepID=UPI001D040457|nr:uncharacterized protein KVR01_013266 [Diaporthe batatas]KAG8156853.1 hypothetical protein KVR01_013266 [Diaporthe batatas]
MSTTEADLREQWGNPRDILSLLLLLGGDIVQKAIAQLVGYEARPLGQRGPAISIAPVAFSFGWVAYGFSSLLAAFGDMALMPPCDHPCILVNCATGFARENRSWALGRLLRDHEIRHEVDSRAVEEGGRAESLRVDVFEQLPVVPPALDVVWWLGWVTVLVQFAIAIVPWIVYGDWTIALVTFCGTFLAIVTCAMPQWIQEKWAAKRVQKHRVTCLTRGNGSRFGSFIARPETRGVTLGLMVLWTCLLITVSGIDSHTWFLVGIGGIGMLQNLFAAGVSRAPEAGRFPLRGPSRVPAVIGIRTTYEDVADPEVDLKETEDVLSQLALWVSASSQKTMPVHTVEKTDRRQTMPRWLESMSREDGVPSWLEPVPCPVDTGSRDGARSSVSMFFSKARGQGLEDRSTNNTVVRAGGGVHGALIELEKWVPTAGLAMLEVFFPQGLRYTDEAVRDNVHKRFWRQAYHTKDLRRKAETQRRQQYRA